jgi:hypothetical protein
MIFVIPRTTWFTWFLTLFYFQHLVITVGFLQMLKIYVKFIKINEYQYHVLELKFKEPDPSLWYFFHINKISKRSSRWWPIDPDQVTFFPHKLWIGMHSEEHDNGEVGLGSHLLMESPSNILMLHKVIAWGLGAGRLYYTYSNYYYSSNYCSKVGGILHLLNNPPMLSKLNICTLFLGEIFMDVGALQIPEEIPPSALLIVHYICQSRVNGAMPCSWSFPLHKRLKRKSSPTSTPANPVHETPTLLMRELTICRSLNTSTFHKKEHLSVIEFFIMKLACCLKVWVEGPLILRMPRSAGVTQCFFFFKFSDDIQGESWD